MFKNFINWLIVSSENPSQLALTVKGAIIFAIPTIVGFFGLFHLELGGGDLTNLANSIGVIVESALTLVGAAIFVYGLARKILNGFIPWPTQGDVVSSLGTPTQQTH